MRRTGRRIISVGLTATIAVSTMAFTGDASSHRAFPDGDWQGIISFFGDTGTARGGFEGSFRLQAAGGTASGDFDWQGIVNTDAVGDVAVTIAGEISGDTTEPLLTLTSGTSGGIPIPDIVGSGNIVPTNITCESIEGVGANITTAAQISDNEWFAIRSDAPLAGGTFFDDLTNLRIAAIDVVGRIGTVPTADLTADINRLVGEAERLMTELDRSASCRAYEFRVLIASQVEKLLRAILEDPALANAAEFADLVLASLRSGVWGPGAADPDAIDIEIAVVEELDRRVDEAIAAADRNALLHYGSLAFALGFDSIGERVVDALVAL